MGYIRFSPSSITFIIYGGQYCFIDYLDIYLDSWKVQRVQNSNLQRCLIGPGQNRSIASGSECKSISLQAREAETMPESQVSAAKKAVQC